jgi:hypothetical protein
MLKTITIWMLIIMEKNKELEKYISCSKQNIDNFIFRNDYKKAFGLLILFLERLDDKEKREVIDYYNKKFFS